MAPKQLKAEQGVEAEEVPKRIRSKSAAVPKAGPKATPKAIPQAAPQHGHKFVAVKTEPSPEDMHVQYGEPPPVTRGPAMTKTRGALRNQFMRTMTRGDPRHANPGSRKETSEKCPHEIIMQMQSKNDEDWWFQVWCANDCKWGEAELWMQKRREEVEDRPQKTRTPTLPHPLTLNVEPYNPRILNLINVFLDY